MSIVGQRFAYRERIRAFGEPVRPVEVVKEGPSRSNKVRVRWLDGECEGLDEWVPKIRLLAPWEEAEALLDEERKMLAAIDVSRAVASDETAWKAAREVFGAMSRVSDPSEELILGLRAVEENLLTTPDIEAASRRLGLDPQEMLAEPYAYVERSGWYKAPFQTALELAKHCCRQFPREILGCLRKEESELRQELVRGNPESLDSWWADSTPRREWAEERIREMEPMHALIRQWCGQEATDEFHEVLALREEVDRLRNLVLETSRWLRDHGHPVKASLLRNQLAQVSEAEDGRQ